MKKRFSKLLILSMTTVLTISMASANAFAEDDASEVSATYACEASIPNASDYGIPELNSDIVAGLKSMGDQFNANYQYVDAAKSTYIQFYGSPVQQFEYDGNPHGLTAGVYATIGNAKVAEANIFYIGQLSDGTYYASSSAPTEPGVYYVAASYQGTEEYYLCRGTNADGSDVNLIRPASVLRQVLCLASELARSQLALTVFIYQFGCNLDKHFRFRYLRARSICRSRDDGLDTIIRIVRYGSRAVCAYSVDLGKAA